MSSGRPVGGKWKLPRAFVPNASWARNLQATTTSTSSRPILPDSLAQLCQFCHDDCLDAFLCFIIVAPTGLSVLIRCSALHGTTCHPPSTQSTRNPPFIIRPLLSLTCTGQAPIASGTCKARPAGCLPSIAREDSTRGLPFNTISPSSPPHRLYFLPQASISRVIHHQFAGHTPPHNRILHTFLPHFPYRQESHANGPAMLVPPPHNRNSTLFVLQK